MGDPAAAPPCARPQPNFDDWIDDNQFSPIRPSSEFSPTLWLASETQRRVTNDEAPLDGSPRGPGIDMDLFTSQDLLCNDIFLAPAVIGTDGTSTSSESTASKLTRLQNDVERLRASIDETERHMASMSLSHRALKQWSIDESARINNLQLKQDGLSPLQRHFGSVFRQKRPRT